MSERSLKGLLGGGLFFVVGAVFLVGAFGMPIGSAARMGPGYFPLAVSLMLMALSLGLIWQSFRDVGSTPVSVAWRPVVAVLAGLLLFGLIVRSYGLVPAAIGTVFISSLADRDSRPLSTLALALFVAISIWLIFRVGLNLHTPAIRFGQWML